MKLTLLEEKKQPLLLRKEVIYILDYPQASTPSKIEVMKLVSGQLKVDEQLLVLDTIQPTFGDSRAQVTVVAYDNKAALQKFSGINKRKVKKKEEAPAKEEKPKEEKKEEAPKVEEKQEEPTAKEEQAPAEEKKE